MAASSVVNIDPTQRRSQGAEAETQLLHIVSTHHHLNPAWQLGGFRMPPPARTCSCLPCCVHHNGLRGEPRGRHVSHTNARAAVGRPPGVAGPSVTAPAPSAAATEHGHLVCFPRNGCVLCHAADRGPQRHGPAAVQAPQAGGAGGGGVRGSHEGHHPARLLP